MIIKYDGRGERSCDNPRSLVLSDPSIRESTKNNDASYWGGIYEMRVGV